MYVMSYKKNGENVEVSAHRYPNFISVREYISPMNQGSFNIFAQNVLRMNDFELACYVNRLVRDNNATMAKMFGGSYEYNV